MSNIIDASNQNPELTVNLGGGQVVSMKVVQQVYAELTGSSESLSRTFRVNHAVSFDDLVQLNAKIIQLYEQYNIVSNTCSVTLYHVDDQSQTFSSFDRFQLFDRTTLSPIENIRLLYNFLIILPKMNSPQSYEIEIHIHSRAALAKKARLRASIGTDMFFELYAASNTANMEISYIDYTVARNFQVAIEHWFEGLPEISSRTVAALARKSADHVTFAFRFLSVAAYLLTCYLHFISKFAVFDVKSLFAASLVSFGGMFLLSVVAGKLGSIAARGLKRLQCRSYLNLTRGDTMVAKEMQASNRWACVRVAVSISVAIAINVFSAWLAIRFGIGA